MNQEEPDPLLAVQARLVRVLALATGAMVLISWPLWVGSPNFPRVAPIPWDLEGPPWLVWLRAGLLLSGLTWLVVRPGSKRVPILLGMVSVLLVWAVLADLERFQTWVYQFLLASLAISTLPGPLALVFARRLILAIYLFSGLSKLDYSFTQELGPLFLDAAVRPWGGHIVDWPPFLRGLCILAMPAGEILAGIFLLRRETRWVGLAGATILHLGLIAILGPWNLGHSTIVLLWNVSVLAQAWILFVPSIKPQPVDHWWQWPSVCLLWVCLLIPALEPFGMVDPWPGHALYASHVERVLLDIHDDCLDHLPAPARAAIKPGTDPPWNRLDFTKWSRNIRGVPVYPGRRANLSIAGWVARRLPHPEHARVTIYSQANRWSGRRNRLEFLGLSEIEDAARRAARY